MESLMDFLSFRSLVSCNSSQHVDIYLNFLKVRNCEGILEEKEILLNL